MKKHFINKRKEETFYENKIQELTEQIKDTERNVEENRKELLKHHLLKHEAKRLRDNDIKQNLIRQDLLTVIIII